MIENDEEYAKGEVVKPQKEKKAEREESVDDLDSLKKLEPMYKGSNAIKAFLNKKTKTGGKK
ncbi:MAG TPA: hypothetical protein PLV58_02615 [Campylobacterales bacterium]|nr:hypothetical protein [Campylobacterales bacterium]